MCWENSILSAANRGSYGCPDRALTPPEYDGEDEELYTCEQCGASALTADESAETAAGFLCIDCLASMTWDDERFEYDKEDRRAFDFELKRLDPWLYDVFVEGYRQRVILAFDAIRTQIGERFPWGQSEVQLDNVEFIDEPEDAHLLMVWKFVRVRPGGLYEVGEMLAWRQGPEALKQFNYFRNH